MTMLETVKRSYSSKILMVFILIIGGLTVNLFQGIVYLTIRPLNMRLFQHINYYLLYSLHAIILFIPEYWSSSDIRIYTDAETKKKLGKEDSIVIVNHTYEIDWMLGWVFSERCSMLGGIKCTIKRVIASVPILGWAWVFSDYLFLDRDWEKDKLTMEKQCQNLQDYATKSWLTVFPEGTRFTEEKHKASMEFARKQGIPILKRHLIPRTKGFVQLVHSLKGHYPAIYDMTVSYDLSVSAAPTMWNMLQGNPVIADCYLRRFELSDLPEDDKEISEWMHQLFREKDALLDSYLTCGSFTGSSGLPVMPLQDVPRRYVALIPVIIWTSLTLYCLYRTALVAAAQGFIGVVLAGGILALAYVGLGKFVNLTRTDKGSSYGSDISKKK